MTDLSLDFRHLRCALAVSEWGSFRRAASELDLPQSTVSRRVQLLEHQLGFPLFIRDRRGANLTVAGSSFLKDALPGARDISRAAEVAAKVQKGETGGLSIGMLASLTPGPIHDILYKFRKIFPKIRITLRERPHQALLHDLVTGTLDVAFVTGYFDTAKLKMRLLWTEAVYAVLPQSHRLVNSDCLSWDDLRDELFLVTFSGSGSEIHDLIIRKVSQLGFRPRIDVHEVSTESLLTLVAMDDGITLSRTFCRKEGFPGIVYRPIVGEHEAVPASIAWASENNNPPLRRFLALSDEVTASTADPAVALVKGSEGSRI
ncbi:LysR family transcriptional regulator [Mesorhizobium amorphae]|uniref:LysR family transcriptional regulator n=1 Tax=Mesorhizobium amorphae TaxID=71433 RepID=UPI0011861CE3|nr:LysR family transcriptional regulator [Mesorhizobium amorphae]